MIIQIEITFSQSQGPFCFDTTMVSLRTFVQSSKHKVLQKTKQLGSENVLLCHPKLQGQ